jgi:hypothetical protein
MINSSKWSTGFALEPVHLAAVARSGLLRRPPSPIRLKTDGA